jgi:hypothetical protein
MYAVLVPTLVVEAGLLTERTGWRRNRVFVCRQALVLIVGGEP